MNQVAFLNEKCSVGLEIDPRIQSFYSFRGFQYSRFFNPGIIFVFLQFDESTLFPIRSVKSLNRWIYSL
jgi:hypothetical protein